MAEKVDFEQELKALEQAVERLEGGELSLEESLRCFEQGVRHATHCREALKAVELKVELLIREADGDLNTEPFEGE